MTFFVKKMEINWNKMYKNIGKYTREYVGVFWDKLTGKWWLGYSNMLYWKELPQLGKISSCKFLPYVHYLQL